MPIALLTFMLPLIREISSIALRFISTVALATVQPLEDSPPRENYQQLTHFGDSPANLTASYLSQL
ncbi:hypothetical protein [Colwellia sp. TT2012]|uniref:hypothetical protein n=1 Tax=Colwellia sp. TT2012 TaxID=1720342 RepID=UPI0007089835|nr:hypothetical protein [Colwellia sp. TT2012]